MSVIMPMSEINGSRVFECRSGWRRSFKRLICVGRSLGAREKCAWWIHVRGVGFLFNEPTTRLLIAADTCNVWDSLRPWRHACNRSPNTPEGTRWLPQEVTSTHTRHLCVCCLSILPHLVPSVSLTGLATNTRKCVNIYPYAAAGDGEEAGNWI
jgi:hypothetical protein